MDAIRVDGRFRLEDKLGSGSYAVVYRAHNIINDQEVAIKLELCTTDTGRISSVGHEYNVLKQLEGAVGFPQPLWFGREVPYYALVINNLGPSLHNIFLSCDRKFSLHSVIILGEQLVSCLEHLHSCNYIHRNIKPQNVLEYCDFTTRAHIPFRDNCPLVGTPAFASLNVHLGVEGGRRDDIESLAYMLIYFLHRSLPWLSDTHISNATILELKQEVSAECLCRGLPYEFATILLYVRTLGFSQKPDYDYIHLLLHGLCAKHAVPNDGLLDFSETRVGWSVTDLLYAN
ncbi:kinase-like protein [Rhizopogon salebrosus TDB-379]|nr:kinase-like protein [Rhizopogon salebrosus TDB-379]